MPLPTGRPILESKCSGALSGHRLKRAQGTQGIASLSPGLCSVGLSGHNPGEGSKEGLTPTALLRLGPTSIQVLGPTGIQILGPMSIQVLGPTGRKSTAQG